MSDEIENVVIIGSGSAGHTAAIYAARARLNPLMLEGFMAGGVAEGGFDPTVDGGLAARGAEAGFAGVGYAARAAWCHSADSRIPTAP